MISEINGEAMEGHKSFEGSKGHETTPAKTRVAFVKRDLFPDMPIAGWHEEDGEELAKQFGWVMAPSNSEEQGLEIRKISYSQEQYGRSDFIPLVFKAKDGTKFLVMYRRGVGGANKGTGDFNSDNYNVVLNSRRRNAGLADEGTTFVEANDRSEMLHNKGIRVRLPIMAFFVDGVMTKDGYKTVDELIEMGVLNKDYKENPPVMSYWARRNPYTFDDAWSAKDVDALLKSQVAPLKNEGTRETNHVAREIEKGRGEKAWFNWLTDLGARQLAKYAKEGFIHPAFHGQNITLAIEIGDLGDGSEHFQLEPLTKDSSDESKNAFVSQTILMLSEIVSLKEHFIRQHGGEIRFDILNREVKKLVGRYTDDLGRTESGKLMLEYMVKNPESVKPSSGITSEFELFMVKKANEVLLKRDFIEKGKKLFGVKS